MRPDVDQLLRRAGSRVRGAAFARGFARGATYLALAGSAGYVAARIADQPEWTAAAWWWAWVAAAAAGLVSGCVACARARFDRAAAAGVLEQRLQTGGLLLAAADGAELSDGWHARLAALLGDAGAALPRVRWTLLAPRLSAALALLAAVQLIPAAAPPPTPAVAAAQQLARLSEQVELLAARTQFDAAVAAELRQQARELERRVAAGDRDVWRELDRLAVRVDREQRLLARAQASGAAGAQPGGAGAGRGAPSQDALAAAIDQLRSLAPEQLRAAAAALPDELRAALEAGEDEAGALPADDASRAALAAALAAAAQAALAALDPSELAAAGEQLRGLLEQLGEGGSLPDLADLGALEALPEELQRMLLDALADGALEDLDLEALRGLLSEDPQSAAALARELAGLAQQPGAGAPQQLAAALRAALRGAGRRAGDPGAHVALRLTEGDRPGAAPAAEGSALALPPSDPAALAADAPWTSVSVEKVAPEVGPVRPAGPGSAGAQPSGAPSWQRRLMPRHREVVRRFFAEKKRR